MSEKKDEVVFYSSNRRTQQRDERISIEKAGTVILPEEQTSKVLTPASHENDNDVCIDVNDVSVMFNLSKNREDGVKEYFINMVKGKVGYNEFWALRNISFQVKRGDSLALIGRNGSGKSTLLKAVAGIIRPARGSIKVNGSVAPLIEISGGFDRSLSARENIFLSGAMHGHTKKYMKTRFDEIVEFAEIEKFLDVPLKSYSSGMVSRLGFAIATCVNADIIIADEVLAVGDARFRMKCEKRISQMLGVGTTFLFVSHSTASVKKMCKKAVWLEKGKIKEIGPAANVCDNYTAYIKSMPATAVKAPDRRTAID